MPAPIELPHDVMDVYPWADSLVDQQGHDPRSVYVERFWLGVLGPSSVWLLRSLVERFDHEPDGYRLDLFETAHALGLSHSRPNAGFGRTVHRLATFQLLRVSDDRRAMSVRRRLPPLAARQLRQLSPRLRSEHRRWEGSSSGPEPVVSTERARLLALTLVEMGESYDETERQLSGWRLPRPLVEEATSWAWSAHHHRRAS